MTQSDLSPLAPAQWDPELIAAVGRLSPPSDSPYARRREQRGGSGGVNALGLLARHPALADAFLGFNRHLLYENDLDDRARELVVLRVSWLLGSPYEWGQHVPVALDCGLGDDEIERIVAGPEAEGWDDRDRLLLAATDQLLASGDLTDELRDRVAELLDTAAILDLIFTVGAYATLAMVFNVARLPLDPDITGFPDPTA